MTDTSPQATSISTDPPWLWAGLAALAVFGLYVVTLAPTTALWDASEYIATAHILGIPHPPGNSFFVVFGRFWILLLEFTGLPVAVRVNLLAATTSAATAFFWYLVSHRLLVSMTRERVVALVGAAVCVLLSATAYTVWNQSNVNEKVYTLSMAVIGAVTWLTLRWFDRRDEEGAERLLLLAGYLMVLGSTNHLMSVLPAPAFLLALAIFTPSVFAKRTVWVRTVPLILIGLSFNMFLPVRAELDPVINEGDPTCEALAPALVAVWTNGSAGCDKLAYNLARKQYSKPPVSERMAPFADQLNNWWQYFDWQWGRGMEASELPWGARTPVSLLFLLLGATGLWRVWATRRDFGVYMVTLTGLLTVGLVFYLNFKYGFSLNPEVAPRELHEVRERDYFFIAGFSIWGMLAGLGLVWTWVTLRDRFLPDKPVWVASPILLVALFPLGLNWGWASRAGDYAARDWAYNLLMSVEPYAILFTNGDNDTFPLWYLQEVEGIRQDVTVVVGQYLFTDWYPKQIEEMTRPENQRRFDPSQGGGWHEEAPFPTRSVTSLTHEQMDGIRGGVLDQDQTLPFPELNLVFPAGLDLDRASVLALRFIIDSADERPAYFSGTSGLMLDMALNEFSVREGIVSKLHVRPLEQEVPGLAQGSAPYGGEWFNLEKTLHLFDEVYSYRGLRDRDIWFDRATLNIPWHFYALALQLSDVVAEVPEHAARRQEFVAHSDAFLEVANGGAKGTPVALPSADSGN